MTNTLKEKLSLELARLDLPWVKKREHNSESSNFSWLPVTKLCGERFLLGLTPEGYWARATKSVVQTIRDETEGVFFLPILEEPPEAAQKKIIDGLKHHGLSEELINTLPLEKIVIVGLKSHSEHWCDLALKWVLFIPRSSCLNLEVEILSRTGDTQKIRHTAMKIVKQLKA